MFPRLDELTTRVDGSGVTVTVHFTKKQGAPVRFIGDAAPAAAVREVDLQRKYHRSALELAKAVGLTSNKSTALRRHLGIDADPACCHEFVFGSQRIVPYSDNAFTRMRDALTVAEMEDVGAAHRPGPRTDEADCGQPGCRSALAQPDEHRGRHGGSTGRP